MLSKRLVAVSILWFSAAIPIGAAASAQRTFVASSGDDANPCTLIRPCRAFNAAVVQTNAGGEVIVLDSAGYGPVTITQSVSIIAPPGVYAGITVSLGDGIEVNGSFVDVVVRGLTINGQGGGIGIDYSQGMKLTVENCEIANMSSGGIFATSFNSTVIVRNTILRNNNAGFVALNAVDAALDGVRIENSGIGVDAAGGSRVIVANSVLVNVGTGVVAEAHGGAVVDVMVTHSTISGSFRALNVFADAGSAASIVSDANAINNAVTGAFAFGNGGGTENIYTSGTNAVSNNSPVTYLGSLTPIGQH